MGEIGEGEDNTSGRNSNSSHQQETDPHRSMSTHLNNTGRGYCCSTKNHIHICVPTHIWPPRGGCKADGKLLAGDIDIYTLGGVAITCPNHEWDKPPSTSTLGGVKDLTLILKTIQYLWGGHHLGLRRG